MDKVINEKLVSLSANLGEAALDSVISDGIFKDIPILGTVISVGKIGYTIVDSWNIGKIIKFINNLDLKNENDINDFKEKYFKDKDYVKIGEKIFSILERSHDEIKIKWLAKCFRQFLDRKLNKDDFMRLMSIINNAYVSDVEKIGVFDTKNKITSINNLIESYVLDHLYSIGLLEQCGFDGGDFEGINSGTVYTLNKFGLLLKDIVLL